MSQSFVELKYTLTGTLWLTQSVYTWVLQMTVSVSVYLSSTNDWPSQCIRQSFVELKYTLTGSVICRTQVYTDWVNLLYNSSIHWLGQSFLGLKHTLNESVICRTQVYTDWYNWPSQCILEFYKWLTQSVYTWVLTGSVICRTQIYTDWVNLL
jgi:hypothetical protein